MIKPPSKRAGDFNADNPRTIAPNPSPLIRKPLLRYVWTAVNGVSMKVGISTSTRASRFSAELVSPNHSVIAGTWFAFWNQMPIDFDALWICQAKFLFCGAEKSPHVGIKLAHLMVRGHSIRTA